MHWNSVSSPTAAIREYRLEKDGHTQVVLRYNPAQNSIRVRAGGFHRLFYLHSAGSLSGRSIFKNEYGIETGQLQWDKWSSSQAVLLLGEQQYRCRLNNDQSNELEVIDPEQRLAGHCSLRNLHDRKPLPFTEHPFLLAGFCWYLSLVHTEVNAS